MKKKMNFLQKVFFGLTQEERRQYLLQRLWAEKPGARSASLPYSPAQEKLLLRALLNVRAPHEGEPNFLAIQDEYLQEELRRKGITKLEDLKPIQDGIYLWRGDITTLRCDAIVNAASPKLLGCLCPSCYCVDNDIHTFAGIQLRRECAELMEKQGREETAGQAKLTSAYNLPSKRVLHTVGPVVSGRPTQEEEETLASCYRSCLKLAEENDVKSLAFCCIATGGGGFPRKRAAEIAVQTVRDYRRETGSQLEVIFDVFEEEDERVYRELLIAG